MIKEYWNKKVIKETLETFDNTEYSLDFGDGYLNISRKDGIHMEVYPCYCDTKLSTEMVTARYTVDGEEKDLDIELPNDSPELLYYVKKILGKSKRKKILK